MSRLSRLADRLADACNDADAFVLPDVRQHGFDDDDMLLLYEATRDKTSELYGGIRNGGFHGGIICTAWLHAANAAVAKASAPPESIRIEELLDTAFDLVVFLGRRSEEVPESFDRAIRGLLHLGVALGVDHIDDRAHSLRGYGGWESSCLNAHAAACAA